MKKILSAFVSILLAGSVSIAAEDNCSKEINTAEGAVTGVAEAGTCAYKGIPYAAPPVGEMRWRPTAPAPKREKTLDAVEFGAQCVQVDLIPAYMRFGTKPNRSEDCLSLNIWRPNKPGKYPVMVWLYGGGLESGNADDPAYWGDRLVSKKDVVLVTVNYRLGALGFLAHEELSAEDEHKSSGNYGMLDQIAALKWVRKNIAEFGGDAGNVTIFGESAGGWSVCMLLASPPAKGLFQKAIIESGGCLTTHSMERGFKDGEAVAKRLNCSGADAVACMRSKPANEVVSVMLDRPVPAGELMEIQSWNHYWAPHLDGWFLKETPIVSLQNGNFNGNAVMVGSNRDEDRTMVVSQKFTWRGVGYKKVVAALKNALGSDLYTEFEKLYPFSNYKKPMEAFVDAKGDILLGCPCFEVAEAVSKFVPTWYYRFDYDNSRFPDAIGAGHGQEIPFVFDSLDRSLFKTLYKDKQRIAARPLVETIVGYWTNFAIAGDPNGSAFMEWPRYDPTKRERMYLDIPQRVGRTDNVEKCAFWREHAPKHK